MVSSDGGNLRQLVINDHISGWSQCGEFNHRMIYRKQVVYITELRRTFCETLVTFADQSKAIRHGPLLYGFTGKRSFKGT